MLVPVIPVARQVAAETKSEAVPDRITLYRSVVDPGTDGADQTSVTASVN